MSLEPSPPDGTALLSSLLPSLEFTSAPDSELLCCRCRQYALRPWLTRCRHLLCWRCMNAILHVAGADTCPVDGLPVRIGEAVLNLVIDSKVRKLLVRCPYHKKGCGKVVALANVKNHMSTCDFIPVFCPAECGLPVSRKDLVSHLVAICPGPQPHSQVKSSKQKNLECFTNSKSLGQKLSDCDSALDDRLSNAEDVVSLNIQSRLDRLTKTVEKLSEELFSYGISFGSTNNVIGHVNGDIIKNGLTELNDSLIIRTAESKLNGQAVWPVKGQRSNIAPDVTEQLLNMIRVMLQKIDFLENNLVTQEAAKKMIGKSMERADITQTSLQHIFKKLERLELQQKSIAERKTESSKRETREATAARRESEKLLERLDALSEGLEQQRTVLLRLVDTVERPWLSEGADEGGFFIWRIEGLTAKRARAASGTETELFSAPFYSHRFGYKLCLRAYPHGYGDGLGTHLSVYVCLMRGSFDELLAWPFQRRFTLRLLDLQGLGVDASGPAPLRPRRDRTQVIDPAALPGGGYTKWNRRPVQERNVGFGLPEFVQLTELDEKGGSRFVRNDTVFLKIIIDSDVAVVPAT